MPHCCQKVLTTSAGSTATELLGVHQEGQAEAAAYEEEMERLQEQLVLFQYWIHPRPEGAGDLRGPRLGRQGRVIKRITERTRRDGPGRRPAQAHRAAAHAVVLPAVRRASAGRRRDGALRPVLVQPLERRVGDGLLLRGGAPGVPALVPGVRADAGAVGDQGDQVLVLGRFEEQRSASRPATPSRSSAGSSATWTSPSTSYTSGTRWRRTPPSSTPTSSRPLVRRPLRQQEAARLNCIDHLLSQFDYVDVAPDVVELPVMTELPYMRPPMHEQTFVPELF